MPRLSERGSFPNRDKEHRHQLVARQIWLSDLHEVDAVLELFPDKHIEEGGLYYVGTIQLGVISRTDGLMILQRINDRGNQLRNPKRSQ